MSSATSQSQDFACAEVRMPGFVGSDRQAEQSGYISGVSLAGSMSSPLPQ